MSFFEIFPGVVLFLAIYFIFAITLLIYLIVKKHYKSLCLYGICLIIVGLILVISGRIAIGQFAEAANLNNSAKPFAKLIVDIASNLTPKTGVEKAEFLSFWVSAFLYSTVFYGFFLIPYGFVTSIFSAIVMYKSKRGTGSDLVR
jgi:hypothetical protein